MSYRKRFGFGDDRIFWVRSAVQHHAAGACTYGEEFPFASTHVVQISESLSPMYEPLFNYA